jgi:tetraacyldisaccharide 4'-kinase
VAFRDFPDHHEFNRSDTESISTWGRDADPDFLICTHKDLVKLNVDRLARFPLFALTIEIEVTQGLEELESLLRQIEVA